MTIIKGCEYCNGSGKSLLSHSNIFDEVTDVTIMQDNNLRLKTDDGFVEESISFCPKCGRDLRL